MAAVRRDGCGESAVAEDAVLYMRVKVFVATNEPGEMAKFMQDRC